MSTVITKESKLSSIWIIPLLAVLIGGWMTVQYYLRQGPTLTIMMPDADGIVAGKTELKSRSVSIGVIEKIELDENFSRAIATARLNSSAKKMLVDDTLFWIVKPRIGQSGVSGLTTLLSGSYIEVRPGKSKVEQDHFTLLNKPPVAGADVKGIHLNLKTNNSSLSIGAPIIFRGFSAGEIEDVSYDVKSKTTYMSIFIHAPFDSLITTNTRFWKTPAFEMSINSSGLNFAVNSMDSLLLGSVTFDLPAGWKPGNSVAKSSEFTLYENAESIIESTYSNYVDYVLLFDQSIEGLNPDADIKYRGIPLGKVIRAPYFKAFFQKTSKFQSFIPVLIRIQLDRWPNLGDAKDQKQQFSSFIKKGLQARIKSSNLITGAKYIDIFFDDKHNSQENNEIQFKLADEYELHIIPTANTGIDELEQKVQTLLTKLNNLQIEPVLDNMNTLLEQTSQTAKTADQTIAKLQEILATLQKQQTPAKLGVTIEQLNKTLADYSAKAPLYNSLQRTSSELEQALIEIRPFLRKISDNPNAIIFNEQKQAEPKLRK